MHLGTVYFGIVNFPNVQTWLKDYSGQDASRDMANSLFLLTSDLVVFYRHAESCQFVAFFNPYFYRHIYWHAESCQLAAFIINPIFFSFQGWLLLLRTQSWFNPVVYYMKFWMVPLYLRSKYCFSQLATSVFKTHTSGYIMFIFIIKSSFEQLPNQGLLDYSNHGWIR